MTSKERNIKIIKLQKLINSKKRRKKIIKLQNLLDSIVTQENLHSEKVISISKELDILITEEIKEQSQSINNIKL